MLDNQPLIDVLILSKLQVVVERLDISNIPVVTRMFVTRDGVVSNIDSCIVWESQILQLGEDAVLETLTT